MKDTEDLIKNIDKQLLLNLLDALIEEQDLKPLLNEQKK